MPISLIVAAKTDVGRVRSNNEDTFLVADLSRTRSLDVEMSREMRVPDGGILLAVSDGMGGAAAGEVASALVVENLQRELASPKTAVNRETIVKAIEEAVASANQEVWNAAKAPGKQGMGATLTAVFLHGPVAYIAEVGDSRAYLVRGTRIRQMTKDQSYVQLLMDAGTLSPEEAKKSPQRNVILQAMGQKPDVTVALGKLDLRRHDRLILCSDGLTNKVTSEETRDVVLRAASVAEACEALVELANERGGQDNVTVIVCQVGGDELAVYRDDESVTQTYHLLKDYPRAASAQTEPRVDARGDGERSKQERALDEDGVRSVRRTPLVIVALMVVVALLVLYAIVGR